jgi:hypothetical protein
LAGRRALHAWLPAGQPRSGRSRLLRCVDDDLPSRHRSRRRSDWDSVRRPAKPGHEKSPSTPAPSISGAPRKCGSTWPSRCVPEEIASLATRPVPTDRVHETFPHGHEQLVDRQIMLRYQTDKRSTWSAMRATQRNIRVIVIFSCFAACGIQSA